MASDVDPDLCTHVVYAFAKVTGNSIEPYEWNDINEWGKFIRKFDRIYFKIDNTD